jgi:thiol-disulfide isomerase/thioredoxin
VYRDNIADYYQQKYKLSPSNDTAYISKVATILPAGTLRDFLVYNKIKGLVGRARDSASREKLITKYLPVISQQKTQQLILTQHYILNGLTRGTVAPDFITTALNKDTFSLENFKGRYVVIDVWATWCGPCKIQSPNFEKLAEQFTSPSVAFVALSIDDSKWSWRNEATQKSSRVLQLIANDKNVLGKSYGIETIPRFMLLGPDGKIINVQMPYPSEPEFEDILKREIPGLGTL